MNITPRTFINDAAGSEAGCTTGREGAKGQCRRPSEKTGHGARRAAVVAVTNGRLDFGTWERIFYGEFDGRRRKRVFVKIIGE